MKNQQRQIREFCIQNGPDVEKWDPIRAELTLIGNPSIQLNEYCRVVFYYPHSYHKNPELHWSSGIYHISKITHMIDGSVKTKLNLTRR